jgi:hypothetical protein
MSIKEIPKIVVISIAVILGIVAGYFLFSFYFAFLDGGGTTAQFLSVIILDRSCLLLVAIASISVFYLMEKVGYDFNSKLHGVASVFFLYGAVALFVGSGIMVSLPVQSTAIVVNSTITTNTNFIYSNSSNPLNFTQVLSFGFTNITESIANMSTNTTPQKEALAQIGSGTFANGIGLFGIALTLFGLLLYNLDKINDAEIYRYPVDANQIKSLGMICFFGACFIDLLLFINYNFLRFLPISPPWSLISLFFYDTLFVVIGVIFLVYGYRKLNESVNVNFDETTSPLEESINTAIEQLKSTKP